jgi:hypothetical protein
MTVTTHVVDGERVAVQVTMSDGFYAATVVPTHGESLDAAIQRGYRALLDRWPGLIVLDEPLVIDGERVHAAV